MKKKIELSNDNLWGYIFVAPVVLGFLVFAVAPMFNTFLLSFTDASLFNAGKGNIVFLDNYKTIILSDLFWLVLKNTAIYAMGLVPLNIILSIGLALLLNNKLKGMSLFKTLLFIPVITSVVAWSTMWRFILGTETGLLNMLLRTFGIAGPRWLFSETLTMPIVIVISVLKSVGVNTIIVLTALQGVSKELYEAAIIDGANSIQKIRYISLPSISPTIFMLILLTLIGSFKSFGQIYTMTKGGPIDVTRVISLYIYDQAFTQYKFGFASAISIILLFILIALTLLQWNYRKRWVNDEN